MGAPRLPEHGSFAEQIDRRRIPRSRPRSAERDGRSARQKLSRPPRFRGRVEAVGIKPRRTAAGDSIDQVQSAAGWVSDHRRQHRVITGRGNLVARSPRAAGRVVDRAPDGIGRIEDRCHVSFVVGADLDRLEKRGRRVHQVGSGPAKTRLIAHRVELVPAADVAEHDRDVVVKVDRTLRPRHIVRRVRDGLERSPGPVVPVTSADLQLIVTRKQVRVDHPRVALAVKKGNLVGVALTRTRRRSDLRERTPIGTRPPAVTAPNISSFTQVMPTCADSPELVDCNAVVQHDRAIDTMRPGRHRGIRQA